MLIIENNIFLALTNLSASMILGYPLVVWFGLLTLLSLLITAIIGFLYYKGIVGQDNFKWHPRFVVLTIIIAVIHITLATAHYFA
jgi:predicted membrane metal-binding protein